MKGAALINTTKLAKKAFKEHQELHHSNVVGNKNSRRAFKRGLEAFLFGGKKGGNPYRLPKNMLTSKKTEQERRRLVSAWNEGFFSGVQNLYNHVVI